MLNFQSKACIHLIAISCSGVSFGIQLMHQLTVTKIFTIFKSSIIYEANYMEKLKMQYLVWSFLVTTVAIKLHYITKYENAQEVIDLHYYRMINIQSLRCFVDQIGKHLRSLEALRQDVNQDLFIAMIRAKLPENMLSHLEMSNGSKKEWTLATLRDKLNNYFVVCERTEKKTCSVENKSKPYSLQRNVRDNVQSYPHAIKYQVLALRTL
jgi:hypothetical protein